MKTKKITRKGCRNVQLAYYPDNYGDIDGEGSWYVVKIHPDKPATFVTRTKSYLGGMGLRQGTFIGHKTIDKFPYFPRGINTVLKAIKKG